MDARDGQVAPGERLDLLFPRNHNGIPSRNNKIPVLASSSRRNAKAKAKTKKGLRKKEEKRKKSPWGLCASLTRPGGASLRACD